MSASAALSITKFLTSPTRVAHALDWKKVTASVLSLHVGKDCIDLAVTGLHPSLDKSVQPLPSIPLKKTSCKMMNTNNSKSCFKTTLHPSVVQELHDLVKDWDVCGFVVSWPVQKEGRCGAQCGRVLHTLDQIVAADINNSNNNNNNASSNCMFNYSRPVCLWDSNHVPAMREDEWGRSATYVGRTTTTTAPADTARNNNNSSKPRKQMIHYASVEQYQDDGAVAAEIAADYMRHFFPEQHHQYHQHHQQQNYSDIRIASSTSSSSAAAVDRAVKKATATTAAASSHAASPQFDIAWLEDAPAAC